MRVFLNRIYDSAAALAALFMCAMLVMVLLSIIGREFNFHIRGTDAYAGYCMAASGFLALAHTLKRGEHIRVTVLISRFKGGWLKGIELWALGMASLLACLLAYYSIRLSWQSYHISRHLYRQRCNAFVDSTNCHGPRHAHFGSRLCR